MLPMPWAHHALHHMLRADVATLVVLSGIALQESDRNGGRNSPISTTMRPAITLTENVTQGSMSENA